LSRGEQSVSRVREICIGRLDVTYEKEDLEAIKFDGQASLDSNYPEGVIENLMLFAEILGWQAVPRPFQVDHCAVYGDVHLDKQGKTVLGPAVVYQRIHQQLKYMGDDIAATDREGLINYQANAAGDAATPIMGKNVFQKLLDLALGKA
jgi:hypothetical protein